MKSEGSVSAVGLKGLIQGMTTILWIIISVISLHQKVMKLPHGKNQNQDVFMDQSIESHWPDFRNYNASNGIKQIKITSQESHKQNPSVYC